jgi:hypothetical protein
VAQKKRHSVLETVADAILGYLIALLTMAIVFPLHGIESNIEQQLSITLCFTAVSMTRKYVTRRIFTNWFGG